jgi:tetratricopeptide (TPR) repeat protein
VFARGCTLEAAEVVCQAVHAPAAGSGQSLDILDGVASLVDKSLLRQQEQSSGEPRFTMLETIREYGLECLTASGEEPAVRRGHADYYLALAEAAEPALTGSEQATWLERLEAEHDNLRVALRWAEESGEAEIGLRLVGALGQFWLIRGHLREGREQLTRLLGLAGASPRTAARAKVLTRAGHLAHNLGDFTAARVLFEESLALWRELGGQQGIATSLNDLGWVVLCQGDYSVARSLSQESLALWRELGDQQGIATSLHNLGRVAHCQGDYAAARVLHQESLALQQALEDQRGIAFALTHLGWAMHKQGDYRGATALLEQAMSLFQAVGVKQLFAIASVILAEVAHDQGEDGRAEVLIEQSLTLYRELGAKQEIPWALSIFGTIAHAQGDHGRAQALLEESLALQRAIGIKWGMATALNRLGMVAHTQGDGAL